jgi:hypothetical protein
MIATWILVTAALFVVAVFEWAWRSGNITPPEEGGEDDEGKEL